MRCLLFAYSEIGAVGFETLTALGHEVVGLVTHADDPAETRWWRSVADLARERGAPVISPENPNTPETEIWARNLHPDILFSFYYRHLLKAPLLEVAPLGAYNLHGSLLPKFRGRAPVNWAILEGETETGLTLHEMVAAPDAGAILDQASVSILEADTAREVFEKLVPLVPLLLKRTVPRLENGTAERRPQDPAQASYRGGRKPSDGRIDWTWDARRIHNLVRAVTRPYPGAFTSVDGRSLFIWKGHVAAKTGPSKGAVPGVVTGSLEGGVGVVTAKGYYVIQQAQFDGEAERPPHELLSEGTVLGG